MIIHFFVHKLRSLSLPPSSPSMFPSVPFVLPFACKGTMNCFRPSGFLGVLVSEEHRWAMMECLSATFLPSNVNECVDDDAEKIKQEGSGQVMLVMALSLGVQCIADPTPRAQTLNIGITLRHTCFPQVNRCLSDCWAPQQPSVESKRVNRTCNLHVKPICNCASVYYDCIPCTLLRRRHSYNLVSCFSTSCLCCRISLIDSFL